ncbi:MAG: Mov34/MPN/PAD-1 family protein [Candidatus Lokiarchaeota archaeon]|nr:Mov34/MPN/PAD-1 family protein [Candidatus Lokiarchaeota archaeon]
MKLQKDIILRIPDCIFNKAIECVNNAYPNEACGLIFGRKKEVKIDDNDYNYEYIGKKFICVESDEKSSIAFLIKNENKLNSIFMEVGKEVNMKLLSIFHSHPSGNHPSRIDKKNMKLLNNSNLKAFKYSIWSIMDGRDKTMNGFIYYNNDVYQIQIKREN